LIPVCQGEVFGTDRRATVTCGRNAVFATPRGTTEVVLWRDAGGKWLGPCHMPKADLDARWPGFSGFHQIGAVTPAEKAKQDARDRWALHALSENGQGRTPGAFGHLVDQQERQWWDWRRFK
jgi:hypothetical protein